MSEAYNIASVDKLTLFLNSRQAVQLNKDEYDALDELTEIYYEVGNICFKEEATELMNELEALENYLDGYAVQNVIKTVMRDLTHKEKILPSKNISIGLLNIKCPYCSSEMELRFGPYESFWACPYHFSVTKNNNY